MPELTILAEHAGLEAGQAIANALPELGNAVGNSLGDKVVEGAKTFAPAANYIAGAVVGVAVVYAAVELKKEFYPDKEQQARNEIAMDTIEYYKSKRELKNCLLTSDSSASKKNDEGIPSVCQKLADEFRMCAGENTFNEMTTKYKKSYKARYG